MSKQEKIKAFDFIRAISVLMIIMFHFISMIVRNGGGSWSEYKLISPMGSIGVSFFIIISGAGLYISSQNWNGLLHFYVKRFKAIFPTFWFVYFIMSCIMFICAGRVYIGSDVYRWAITIAGFDGYLSWYIPTYYVVGEWFIGFILLIYLVFPIIRMSLNANKAATFIASIAVAIAAFTYNKELSGFSPLFNANAVWNPLVRLPEFIYGALIADMMINKSRRMIYLVVVSFIYLIISVTTFDNLDKGFYSVPSLCAMFTIIVFLYSKLKVCDSIYDVIAFFSASSFIAFLIHHKIIGIYSLHVHVDYKNHVAVYLYMCSVLLTVFVLSYFISKPLKYVNACFK